MKRLTVAAPFLLSLMLVQGALGASIYVSPAGTGTGSIADPAGLQAALDIAKANAEDDTIFLQAGAYTNDPGFKYDVSGTDPVSLTLSGGWDASYTSQDPNPAASAIDGQTVRRALLLQGDGSGVNATVTLANLAVQNGYTNEHASLPGETGFGAGIYVRLLNEARLKLVLSGCVVQDNVAAHADSVGGGVYTSGDFALAGSSFLRNRADANGGGALFSDYASPYDEALAPTIDNCLFEANVSGARGGAHLFTTVAPVVKGTSFKGRPGGVSSVGAGIRGDRESHLFFERCRFEGNIADGWGGAVYLWDSAAEFRNCLFLNNVAGFGGTGAGGAVMTDCDTLGTPHTTNIVNCTLHGNMTYADTPATGGAVYNRLESVNIVNSILWNNGYHRVSTNRNYYGDNFQLMNSTSGSTTCTISYSNNYGGIGSTSFVDGGGNMIEPPRLTGNDYKLTESSLCLDTGSNAAVPAGLDQDFEGNPRIFAVGDLNDRVVDMGWDEFVNGSLALTAPVAGTVWLNDGTGKTITWSCTNIGGDVRLSLWTGDPATGSEVAEIAAAVPCADQTYTGSVLPPALPDAADYYVVIESVYYPTFVHSMGPVTTRHLQLTWPNGGNSLVQGSRYTIKWLDGNLPGQTVKIQLYNGPVLMRTMSGGAPNTGSFVWTVPYMQVPMTTYRVKISTTAPIAAEDWSNANFKILPAVTLTAPNGGQTIKRGTTFKIMWTYKNKPGSLVQLDLFKGGVFNRTIAKNVPIGTLGKGSYLWTVAANQAPSSTYTVRIRSMSATNCFDLSNANFKITQ